MLLYDNGTALILVHIFLFIGVLKMIKLLSLSYAVCKGAKVYVPSLDQHARVTSVSAPEHTYGVDYLLHLKDGQTLTITWDHLQQAHVFDTKGKELIGVEIKEEALK